MSGAGVLLFQRGQVGQNIKATGDGGTMYNRWKSADFSICGYKGESSKTDIRENFDPVFIEIWFFDTQNTFYLIVDGLKNYSCPFLDVKMGAGLLQMIIRRNLKMELEILVVGWKLPFLV